MHYLQINGCKIIDVNPLASGTFKELNLCSNNIRDLSPLSTCDNMHTLYTQWNDLIEFDRLNDCKSLKELYIDEHT